MLYIGLFGPHNAGLSIIYKVFNGVGHMWFLPMLFWCFIAMYFLLKWDLKDKYKVILLIVLSVCSFIPLPLRIGNMFYYLLFFYGGYSFFGLKTKVDKYLSGKRLISLWMIFIGAFFSLTLLQQEIPIPRSSSEVDDIIFKAIGLMEYKICQIVYSSIGVLAIYCTAVYYTNKYPLPHWYMKIGAYCFGVYLFQQFILQALYYQTCLPELAGPVWLPWFGFAISLSLSLILTVIFRKTRLGKFII